MIRYVVSHLSFFDNEINISTPYANSGAEAMAQVLDLQNILGKPLKDITENDVHEYASNTDQVIDYLQL